MWREKNNEEMKGNHMYGEGITKDRVPSRSRVWPPAWLQSPSEDIQAVAASVDTSIETTTTITQNCSEPIACLNEPIACLTETTIRCPFCSSVKFLDGDRGLWCLRCERLAWLVQNNVAVRADMTGRLIFDPVTKDIETYA